MKKIIMMLFACGLIVSGNALHAMEQDASNALVQYSFKMAKGFPHRGTDFVTASPDGKSIVSVSSFDTSVVVRKKDAQGSSLMTYNYPYQVKYAVFSGDSSMAAIGLSGSTEQDNGFTILNMKDDGSNSTDFTRHLPNVCCLSLAFTPDNQKVIAANSESVHMVRHDTGQALFSVDYGNHSIAKCLVSNALLYILMQNGPVKRKALDDFKPLSNLTYTPLRSLPGGWGASVDASADKVAMVSKNATDIAVHDIKTGTVITKISNVAQMVDSIAISPDGTMIACDAMSRLYIASIDPSCKSEPHKIFFGNMCFESITFSPDSRYVLVVSNAGGSAIFEAKTGKKVFDFETENASHGCFDSNGNAFVAGRDNRGSVAIAERFVPEAQNVIQRPAPSNQITQIVYDGGDDCCVS